MLNPTEICLKASMIPVIVVNEVEDAVPLARALIDGGLPVLEVTLRSDCALQAIEHIAHACPEAIIGAGTLKRSQDVTECITAGAVFGVSPGSPLSLIEEVLDSGFAFLPGCATPSEAMTLSNAGFDVVKFFPAEAAGGIPMLKSMASPLPDIKFCPTGGISLNNAKDYLDLPNVLTVGGSWVVPNALLTQKDWPAITKLAQQAVATLTS